ncbi:MAG: tRNA 2-thiouridine(34) synthase MnmA [Phycisphaerae bacterium]|nr:tRNA 2-thiouridine(34) synthase MnmA [Phycisphaerae bacterium]
MGERRKILVAMSGGVDSSVAAALLREAGHDVVGVFMCMNAPFPQRTADAPLRQSCCSPQDSADARAVCARLGVPFYVLNFQDEFAGLVDYFVDEYNRGRTPNPCVLCNSRLKFGRLLDYAATIGADAVATGHYARVVATEAGPRLARAADDSKDQSYVLFDLPRQTLARVVLPLGDWAKADVRAKASAIGLAVSDKPDSQDICFVPDGDYGSLVEARRPGAVRPGDVLDAAGKVVGRHRGYQHYTIGQRRGLGIAAGSPIYVTAIDAAANTVTVGPAEALLRRSLTCSQMNWHIDAGEIASEPFLVRAWVKIRYKATPATATVRVIGAGRASVEFDRPVAAVTPGQAAVFYDDAGLVLGGGWID